MKCPKCSKRTKQVKDGFSKLIQHFCTCGYYARAWGKGINIQFDNLDENNNI